MSKSDKVSEAAGEDIPGEVLGTINGINTLTGAPVRLCHSFVLFMLVICRTPHPLIHFLRIIYISLSTVVHRGPGTTLLWRSHDLL